MPLSLRKKISPQMVARQFVDIRSDIQNVQDEIRKISTRQTQVEADISEVGHICEQLKRRLSIIHDGMGTADRFLHDREVSLRLDISNANWQNCGAVCPPFNIPPMSSPQRVLPLTLGDLNLK